jgi:RimJ/RimL family protein N-acetyltransferase
MTIAASVVDASPARWPERIVLRGRVVSLVPLDAEAHGEELYRGSNGDEVRDRLWDYLFDGPYADLASFTANLKLKAASTDMVFYAIVDNESGVPVGYASYLRIEPAHRVIEVGNILFTPALQRTVGATEAMYLMARYVFDELGYRRYEWKCNALNAPSRVAARRLGFSFEGIFRQHMIIKGRNRDTAWFSMLDSEWPARKAAFERWLEPRNFDEQGRQRERLGAGAADSSRWSE